MSNVPSAAKRKADEARALLAGKPVNEVEVNGDEFIDVNAQTPANAAQSDEHVDAQPNTDGQSAPGGTPGSQAPTEQGGLQERDQPIDPENYKERYTRLRDTRDERATAATQRAAELEQSLSQANSRIQELEANNGQQQPDPFAFELTDEQREYMTDADIAAFETLAAKMSGRMDHIVQKVEQSTRSAREVYYDELDVLVPQWEAINQGEQWKNWLGEIDPVTGVKRQISLESLDSMNRADEVAKLFNSFLARSTSGAANAANNGAQAPVQQGSAAVEYAGGSRGDLSAASQAPEVVYVKASEFKSFYTELQKAKSSGHYRKNKAEWDARKNEFDTAAREKRIVPD